MKSFLFLSIFSFLIISCTSKNSALKYFDESNIRAEATRYTKKADIVSNNQVDIIFMATYLNKINYNLDEKEDNFLVYVYFSNSQTQDIQTNNYEILLNSQVPIYIEKLEKDNKTYKDLMLKNFWGTYYLVKFSNKNLVSKLNITLKPKFNNATLVFEKY